MAYAVRLAALFLALVQSVGLCACRLDNAHVLCTADPSTGQRCTDAGHGDPQDRHCDSHQPQLREARLADGDEANSFVAPGLAPFLVVVPTDRVRPRGYAGSDDLSASACAAVSLPRLN